MLHTGGPSVYLVISFAPGPDWLTTLPTVHMQRCSTSTHQLLHCTLWGPSLQEQLCGGRRMMETGHGSAAGGEQERQEGNSWRKEMASTYSVHASAFVSEDSAKLPSIGSSTVPGAPSEFPLQVPVCTGFCN